LARPVGSEDRAAVVAPILVADASDEAVRALITLIVTIIGPFLIKFARYLQELYQLHDSFGKKLVRGSYNKAAHGPYAFGRIPSIPSLWKCEQIINRVSICQRFST
jgi:hypothetical protein